MERVARFINKDKNSQNVFALEDFVRGVWPAAVGKTIARHTGTLRVVRETLVVEVEDAVWQRQLHALSGQILGRLHKCMGVIALERLEFRIAVPRREPQREEKVRAAAAASSGDEADAILDPVLKKVYRLSRKRSTA
jgi:acyl-CoA hydrolase